MPINSRDKGKRGELEFAKFVSERLAPARRGQQFCGANGDADIVVEGLPVHIEVKRVQKLNLDKAMEQAVSDSPDGVIPIVAHRKNRHDWLCTLRAEDLIALLKPLTKL